MRQTRKAVKKQTMNIPELRRAFEHIERFIQTNEGREITAFRKEWKKMFGKDVSKASAENYLKFVKPKPNGQKGGGMSLSPAPLSYDMRPGTGTVNVPPYISSGFGFANNLSFGANGPQENITPVLPADLGSNKFTPTQKGGGSKRRKTRKNQVGGGSLIDSITTMFRIPASSPPSMAQNIQHEWKGQVPLPVSGAENNALKFVGSTTETIGNQIQSTTTTRPM